METATFIAGIATALATVVLAIAAWLQLPMIARQVRGLSEQIRLSREAEQHAERRTREWETLKACERYNTDPVLEKATMRLWYASNGTTDYKLPGVQQRDIHILLNYLDGIAVGVGQGLYIETLVKDHLGPVFDHAVVEIVEKTLKDRVGIEAMSALHAQWFRGAPKTSYLSSGAVPQP
jgi:hypothetical protein